MIGFPGRIGYADAPSPPAESDNMKLRYISQRRQLIRSYYSGIGKAAVIYPAAFLVAVALGQIGLGLIFYTREVFDASPAAVGWLLAAWSISYVFGCLVLRPVFSRVLPRYLAMAATSLALVFTLGMPIAPNLPSIFVLQGLYGLSLSLFWPPLMGWLSMNAEGATLGKVVSRFNLSWSLGVIISPFIAGWLSERAVRLPLYAGSGLYLLTVVFMAGAVAALPAVRADRDLSGSDPSQAGRGRNTRLRYAAWLGLFATYFGMGALGAVLPMAGRDVLLFSRRLIGSLLTVRAFANAAAFITLGRTSFWHFRSLPMLLGQLLTAAAFVGLACAASAPMIALLLALFGACMALGYNNSFFHGVSGSDDRARRTAVHESILAGGLVAGAGIGGMVYHAWGIAAAYSTCALVLVVGVLGQVGLCAWAAATETRVPGETAARP